MELGFWALAACFAKAGGVVTGQMWNKRGTRKRVLACIGSEISIYDGCGEGIPPYVVTPFGKCAVIQCLKGLGPQAPHHPSPLLILYKPNGLWMPKSRMAILFLLGHPSPNDARSSRQGCPNPELPYYFCSGIRPPTVFEAQTNDAQR